jgi:hypothetical protein
MPLPGGAVWIDHGAIRSRFVRSLVSLAGPLANLVLGALLTAAVAFVPMSDGLAVGLSALALIQVLAFVLNILPVPGLDGAAMRQLQFLLFEAISNVLQHAGATVLRIEAAMVGSAPQFALIDNGRGFDATQIAPRALNERARAIGAKLTLESRPGRTVVRVEFNGSRFAGADNPPPCQPCSTSPRSRDASRPFFRASTAFWRSRYSCWSVPVCSPCTRRATTTARALRTTAATCFWRVSSCSWSRKSRRSGS